MRTHNEEGISVDRQILPDFPCVHWYEVVRIHDGVNQPIQNNGEVHITIIPNIQI